MALLRSFWSDEHVDVSRATTGATTCRPRPTRTRTPPPMYFGGTSEPARDVAAAHADCYLMWIETVDFDRRARRRSPARVPRATGGRSRSGCAPTSSCARPKTKARRAAAELVSELDPAIGRALKEAAHDHQSEGVRRQDARAPRRATTASSRTRCGPASVSARSGVGAAITGQRRSGRGKAPRLRGARHRRVHPVGLSARRRGRAGRGVCCFLASSSATSPRRNSRHQVSR